ncbi:MAG: tRNA uracil 4-sulfurtransferase ThiI [Planctomycetota bacterium]
MNDTRDILIRYGEIGLKGKNRPEFEKCLATNLKQALRSLEHGPVERPHGRIVVRDVARPITAHRIATRIPGVMSASVALRTDKEMESLFQGAVRLLEEALDTRPGEDRILFKVETTRSSKKFPLNSMELSAQLGGRLIERFPRLKARMKDPDLLLLVEVRAEEVLLSTLHGKGPGGLPVGSTGKVMVLLSGGIDSPVAAYMAMKRGARAYYINFHSYPFIPEASLDKTKALVKALSRFQGPSMLYVAPFSEIQVNVKKACPEELRTILYRRMMMRLAEKTALQEGALAIVTGESLGQVASQTLENIGCIGSATSLPVLRPLIGMDKTESVALAEVIGTYPISILPQPDCCTVFQPRRPKIRARLDDVEAAEALLDVEGLVEESFAGIECVKIDQPPLGS